MENRNAICPIYFENHQFGGHVGSIENFTHMNLGTVRTTFLNGRPYFCASDICKGLCLDIGDIRHIIADAVNDILSTYYNIDTPGVSNPGGVTYGNMNNTPTLRMGGVSMDAEELYFYINIEISHPVGNSNKIVKQTVNTLFISEPVFYMLTFRSRKREAVAFKAWLAMDILPNLRALGMNNTNALIGNEYTNITNALEKIDSIYDNIKDYDTQKALIRSVVTDAAQEIQYDTFMKIQSIINGIYYKMDNLGRVEDYALNNTEDLNVKVTDIATGLDRIFRQARRNY